MMAKPQASARALVLLVVLLTTPVMAAAATAMFEPGFRPQPTVFEDGSRQGRVIDEPLANDPQPGFVQAGQGYRWTTEASVKSGLESELSWRWGGRHLSLQGRLNARQDKLIGDGAFTRDELFGGGKVRGSRLTLTIRPGR